MKGGGRIALGVGLGYLLGRTKKMRFAMTLAGAAMARRSAGTPAELLERGTELLKSTPELTKITDTVRDELLGAVRSAAVTAASNRMDALSNRLQQGTTLLAGEGQRGSRAADEEDEEQEQQPEDEYEDEEQEDEYEDQEQEPEDEYEDQDEDEDEDRTPEDEHEEEEQEPEDEDDSERGEEEDDTERPAARTRTRRSSTTAKRGASSRTADRSDSADRKPSGTSGRGRTRAEAGQAPVRRTRR